MATLQELCDMVYTITKRPDLVADTLLQVQAATLKVHQSDFYFKDLFETGIQFDTADYVQQLEISTIIPRYRALKYLRRYDNSGTGAAKEYYKILTPNELLDSYSQDKTGVAYAAGTVLNIKSANLLQYAIIGVYLNPIITPVGFSSWIANDHPFAIAFEASRTMLKTIGFDEAASSFDRLAAEQLALIKINNLQAVGY